MKNDTYRLFRFREGCLVSEIIVSALYDYNLESATMNGYVYEYADSSCNKLILREGNADSGYSSHQWDYLMYEYSNNKLDLILDCLSYAYRNEDGSYDGGEGLLAISKFYYDENQKLICRKDMDGFIDEYADIQKYFNKYIRGDSIDFNFVNLANEYIDNYPNVHYQHYFYKDDNLIGFYPAKTEYFNGKWEKSDTIYDGRKIEELEKIGFEKFSEKYFHGEVLKKIIDDCYGPIKNEQLLVNGKPIRDFLLSIGRAAVRYIIFEVTDNYFLFYKIID